MLTLYVVLLNHKTKIIPEIIRINVCKQHIIVVNFTVFTLQQKIKQILLFALYIYCCKGSYKSGKCISSTRIDGNMRLNSDLRNISQSPNNFRKKLSGLIKQFYICNLHPSQLSLLRN